MQQHYLGVKPHAAIVYLTTARDRDLKDLGKSLHSAYANFLQQHPYPVYIFHEKDLDAKRQVK